MIIKKINFKIKKKKYEYSLGEELDGHKIERIEAVKVSKSCNYREFNIFINNNKKSILYRTLTVPTRYFIKVTYILDSYSYVNELQSKNNRRPEWKRTK